MDITTAAGAEVHIVEAEVKACDEDLRMMPTGHLILQVLEQGIPQRLRYHNFQRLFCSNSSVPRLLEYPYFLILFQFFIFSLQLSLVRLL